MAKTKPMDDLISRQAVLDLFKEYQPNLAVKVYEFGERLKALKPAPTIEAEPVNGWISVKDKMPDEGKEVLIYCPEFLEEIRKAFYTNGDFYAEKEDLVVKSAPNGYCTHWQPLPEPPKGE